MNEKIIVSIIIVNYNSFALLQNCIESILHHSQDFEYEIIVVDNNSTDGDVETITGRFKKIILIKNGTNEGFAKANNKGANIAKGKYLLFLNNDTIIFNNSLKILLDFAEEQTSDFILSCRLLNLDGSFQDSAYNFPSITRLLAATLFLDQLFTSVNLFSKHNLSSKNTSKPINVDAIMGALIFIKRDTFIKLKGFDERFYFYYEDIDLGYELNKIGGFTIFSPETAIYHIGGASAEKDLWFYMKNRSISRIQFAQKNFRGIYKSVFILIEQLGKFYKVIAFLIFGIITFNKNYIRKAGINIKLLFIYPQNKFRSL
jgi:GT2 family glycosyltransferase